MALGSAAAWVVNRYTVPTYAVSASLLAKSDKSPGANEILGGNIFATENRYIADEIAIIKSLPLFHNVLRRMDSQVSYYQAGRFKNSELYRTSPFAVLPLACPDPPGINFYLSPIDAQHFKLGKERDLEDAQTYRWGTSVLLGDSCRCQIDRREESRAAQPLLVPKNRFFFRFNNLDALARSYSSSITIPDPKFSYVLKINTNSATPAKDIEFLNFLMEEYINDKLARKNQSAQKTISFIDSQLGQINDSLVRVENRLERFKKDNKLASGYTSPQDAFKTISTLDQEKSQLLLNGRYIDYVERYLKESTEYDRLVTPNAVNMENEVLGQLIGELVQLQIEKNTYLRNAKERNPFLGEVNAKIANLKASLLEVVATSRSANQIALQNLEGRLKTAERGVNNLPRKEREFVGINRLYTINENIYLQLLQKRLEADVSKASATVDSRIVQPAYVVSQISPDRQRNYLLGLVLGLLVPIVLIYAGEFFRGSIESAQELEQASSIPLLGTILHNEGRKGASTSILDRPKSAMAETFRSLRPNLQFLLGKQAQGKVVLVTSSVPGEGKSFCSANLSLVLALANQRVVHMMADLRRPKLFLTLSQPATRSLPGLSNYLCGEAQLAELIQPSVAPMLDVVAAGPVPPNPSELLLSTRLDELIAHLRAHYDYVVIDTPPMGLVSDAVNLLKHADACLYVVRYKYTRTELLQDIDKMYKSGQVQNIGFVFNDVTPQGQGYGYRKYGYGYGYYDDAPNQAWWKHWWKRSQKQSN
ncbi:MAG: polysaccharide biosynthesis tyrosine autokinase [Bernardetiaceae bacterium]|jgi:capsular exopolysaccharide synthesis family protein|nr:polysaccharide biosynthesis tyrosine autokinase [Bernardetiaceae bacterium]